MREVPRKVCAGCGKRKAYRFFGSKSGGHERRCIVCVRDGTPVDRSLDGEQNPPRQMCGTCFGMEHRREDKRGRPCRCPECKGSPGPDLATYQRPDAWLQNDRRVMP